MSTRPSRSWLGLAIVLELLLVCPMASRGDSPESNLRVYPETISLNGALDRQQIAISIAGAQGTVRDATGVATYTVEPTDLATVAPSGVVTARRDGSGRLRVTVARESTEVPIHVVRSTVPRASSYRLEVAALLSKAGCNSGPCHGNINGKGGFRLSLRGDDPTFDLAMLTRDGFARRVDLTKPPQSLALTKPTGQVPHEGGQRFTPDSTEAATLRSWIAAGAPDDRLQAPTLTRIEVFPPHRIIESPGLSQQLVVLASFSDGSRRDVTRTASYDLNDPVEVNVSVDGRVEARRPIETTVAVRYLGVRGVSRLAFLPDRPDFVGRDVTLDNPIDRAVFAKLRSHKIHPAQPCSDSVFLRRAFLDAMGVLPTPAEARAFLADPALDKRSRLVDRLLERPEFADFWALKWADLLRNEEKTMGSKGVWIFQRWLRDQMAADVPLDLFVHRLVSSTGSNFQNPPSSFYRTNRDAPAATETFSQVFLGVRLQCARCHNHPFDNWTQADYYGLSAYFTNVRRKLMDNQRQDNLDTHEINGDEVIYLAGSPGSNHPRTGEALPPKPPNGSRPELGGNPDALASLADWLTRDNPQFTRNMANRVWYHLMGKGVVDPVDDFRESNPPSNPALLEALASELVSGGYRLRPLVARIMKSRTYALDAQPDETGKGDETNFPTRASGSSPPRS